MRGSGRPKKQQGSMSSAAAAAKKKARGKEKKEKEASKEPAKETEATETGREPVTERLQGRRKEKEMGGEGKEPAMEKQNNPQWKEKENDKENEKAPAEDVCPQFFKVFIPEQSRERLKIPQMFNQHLNEQPTGPVSLKGPSGNKWQAALTSESEVWSFEQGWKEFATDHSLGKGYFLVFTYNGTSQFSVAVLSPLGINDPAAFDAKPTNDVVPKIEEDEGLQGDMDPGGGTSVESLLPTEEGDGVTGKRTTSMSGGISEISPVPTEEGNGVTGKRTRAMSDLPSDANAPKRNPTVTKKAGKRRRAQAGTSKGVPTRVHNSTFSLLDESKSSRKTHIRDKSVPRIGKFLLKTSRAPIVTSQRRPVTEEEKNLAFRKAKEFKSKYPFTVQTMIRSVYSGFFMNIACKFFRESLPQTNKKITLWDPLVKPWEVNYLYYSNRSVGGFSGGWGKFALGTNLEEFDVCVFELFKEDNIRVHIYRVVPEITPLLCASNRD